jgi:hypothetical protein
MSEGPSPRNGPWKKLVNSPGFALRAEEGISGATSLGGAGGVASGVSFGGAAGFALNGSQGTAVCSPDSPGRLVEGAGRTGGVLGRVPSSGALDFASESKSRNSCVIWPGACGGSLGAIGGATRGAATGVLNSAVSACPLVSFVSSS